MTGSKAKETKKRLEILNKTNDGFKIASEDLKLRGPGDLFGIRQSGLIDFGLGDIYQDAAILQKANEAAANLTATQAEIDEAANQRLEQMMPQLAEAAGATEALKAADPMAWVGLMNTCKAQAEEILLAELINS